MRFTFELKPEKIEVVEEIVERFVEAWGAMSYPYRVTGYRSRFGEVGKVHFMIFLDEPSAFRGENDAMAVAERAGQGEAYGALMEELAGYIEGVKEDLITYRPALSYTSSPADPE